MSDMLDEYRNRVMKRLTSGEDSTPSRLAELPPPAVVPSRGTPTSYRMPDQHDIPLGHFHFELLVLVVPGVGTGAG